MTRLIPAVNENDHSFGSPAARIELVEYGDYECPYCGRAYPIIKNIQQRLGNEIRFIFRNFPLSKLHPNAFPASVATEAAALQGKFWEMHDIIFENQRALDEEHILLYAGYIGLHVPRFQDDMEQKILAEKVRNDFDSGLRSGVNRTPTFFINGYKYEGEWAGEALYQYLKELLKMSSVFY